ncbi:MAG: hypothetical protein M3R30_00520 [Candidatus Eremiobacteraeota bacterium]|nr:hypothetical protein [Candidatus Eremiobacteraeota bacterium]
MKRLALALTLAAIPLAAPAQSGNCTKEVLPVRGTPVTVTYCVEGTPTKAPGSELLVKVAATYSAPGGSYSNAPVLRFIAAEGPSRVIEDLDLAKVGSRGTLHLTLVYKAGAVSIESALLTPGAVPIK